MCLFHSWNVALDCFIKVAPLRYFILLTGFRTKIQVNIHKSQARGCLHRAAHSHHINTMGKKKMQLKQKNNDNPGLKIK